MISGWSDWVASNQIITKNLPAIGIDSNVALEPDWGSWQPNAWRRRTRRCSGRAVPGLSVRLLLREPLQNAFIPSGKDGTPTGNWEHYSDAKATKLLNTWKVTLDPAKQQRLATQLENILLQGQPIIPLFIGPRWSTYSTKYFHCYRHAEELLGDPIFTTFPDNILSFTRDLPGR